MDRISTGGTFAARPPRLGFFAAGFATFGPVAFRALLAFDRVTLGFSIVLIGIVSETLGAMTLEPAAAFIDGMGLSGEAG